MAELLLTIGGVLFGFFLSTLYEKHKDKKVTSASRKLLIRELSENIQNLNGVLDTIKDLSSECLPNYIEPLTIEEISQRVERACKREAFEACYHSLSHFGAGSMNKIFSFYDSCHQVPNMIHEIERFAGSIRAGLFEDNIQYLIEKGQTAMNEVKG